jgi:hypothetical chaperone protein
VVFFHAEDEHVSYGRAALADYLAGYEGPADALAQKPAGHVHDRRPHRGRRPRAAVSRAAGAVHRRAQAPRRKSRRAVLQQAVLGRPVFFVDDDAKADKKAENTLAEIAHAVGLKDIAFQYEPIAAAFDYESQIRREELVLVVDIGGGTSDFALVRLSPERARKAERRDDILASGGVHIGGTDFDKYLSLASVMPTLGLGSRLVSGLEVPSAQYFNLATWHTINQVYSKKSWTQISDIRRSAVDKDKLDRLHEPGARARRPLAGDAGRGGQDRAVRRTETTMDLGRIAPGETLTCTGPISTAPSASWSARCRAP